MKVNVGLVRDPKPKAGFLMTGEEMNPGSLYLREGQEFFLQEHDPETREKRKKHVKIIKLYKHHALCLVNGRRRESFTYNELYTMKAGGGNA